MENKADINISYKIQLPADLDYISPLRQFISDLARSEGFSNKFCFRVEIIIDEMCTNAIIHGLKGMGGYIGFNATLKGDDLELIIKNKARAEGDIKKLKSTLQSQPGKDSIAKSRGIALVKVLSNSLDIDFKDGYTYVKVIKKRERAAL